MSASLANY